MYCLETFMKYENKSLSLNRTTKSSEYTVLTQFHVRLKPNNVLYPWCKFTIYIHRDEVEVHLDELTLGRYILIKFLRPRDTAERLGILGVRFYGHVTNSSAVDNMIKVRRLPTILVMYLVFNSDCKCWLQTYNKGPCYGSVWFSGFVSGYGWLLSSPTLQHCHCSHCL